MATAAAPVTDQSTGGLTVPQIQELKGLLIPEVVEQYPDIIQMVFQTPSLIFDEKKYWLQLLPLMTPDHVERLRSILTTERQKLAEINARYDSGVNKLQQLARPNYQEMQKKRQEMHASEAAAAVGENSSEEELMRQLKGV